MPRPRPFDAPPSRMPPPKVILAGGGATTVLEALVASVVICAASMHSPAPGGGGGGGGGSGGGGGGGGGAVSRKAAALGSGGEDDRYPLGPVLLVLIAAEGAPAVSAAPVCSSCPLPLPSSGMLFVRPRMVSGERGRDERSLSCGGEGADQGEGGGADGALTHQGEP